MATLAAVVAAVLAAAPVVPLALGQLQSDIEPDQLSKRLANAVRRQWEEEANIRQLRDPQPLRLRWSAADSDLMDHPEVVIPNVGSPRPLSLGGGLDEVAEAFRRLPRRRLVVIGEPGAGKTAFLVLLTLRLLAEQQQGEPFPVLFSLSSWDPHSQSLQGWLQKRLEEDYSWLRARGVSGSSVAADLVSQERVVPLLDGLDELSEAARPTAIEAINRVGVDLPVVVACRRQEYEQALDDGDVLTAAAVVELEPVLPEDVEAYLRRSTRPGPRLEGWKAVFAELRHHQSPIAMALSTPLMVSLARIVYASGRADPAELVDRSRLPSREAIEDHLLDAYIPALFHSGGAWATVSSNRRTVESAQPWFTFLASYLDLLGTRDFAWWQLGTLGLWKAASGIIVGIPLGLLFGLFASAMLGFNPLVALLLGPVFGVLVALLNRWTAYLRPRRVGRRRGLSVRRLVASVTGAGLIFGVAGALMLGIGREVEIALRAGIFSGLIAVGAVLVTAPTVVFSEQGPDDAATPASTLRSDRVATVLQTVAYALLLSIADGFIGGFLAGGQAVRYGIVLSVGFGLLQSFGGPWTWYQFARFQLALRGLVPWRLMTFLEHAHRLGVLRQVGPVYQFRHSRLQDRLAARVHNPQ